ncbi:hypothetical protein [Amnibacterium kyonggiense]|uniref:Uncharacterized protein n=1 Tax=Amnibacterium kyonggiense TaxID=595671 RepID=A0A4R7FP39_9MICO|nr:hypothetical protein [Amnibacterium kyonggiense]TDS79501.1 hypothetical protein CLV52_0030 [Amnibacterium kyonggiense]
MGQITFWGSVTLVVVLAACVIGVVVAVRIVVRAVRSRNAPPTGLRRAGAPEGTDDPRAAFDRAAGKTSWTRISGGL